VPFSLLLLMLAAPAVVVGLLLAFHDVFTVFGVYHLGICLVLPLVANVAGARMTVAEHGARLGLTGRGTGRAMILGLVLALVMGGGMLGVFALWGERLLAGNAVVETLADWGAPPARHGPLFVFMALGNAPAEELFWRGFVASEMPDTVSRPQRLLLPSICYASYHAATVLLFIPDARVAFLMLAAVLMAGTFWAWLRERTGSVWPSLLSHTGATLAYMAVARPLLDI